MEVVWEVQDGYVRPARFTCHVDDDELAECETEEQREDLIAQCVQDDFESKVSWSIVSKG